MELDYNLVSTEAYAQSEYVEIKKQDDESREYLKESILQINQLLGEHSPAAYKKLCDLCNNQYFIQTLRLKEEIALVLVTIKKIYKAEVSDDVKATILDHIDCINDLRDYINEYKFLLWNIEFDVDSNQAFVSITDAITHNDLSITALSCFINLYSVDKYHIFLFLSLFWKTSQLYQEAYELLLRAASIFENDTRLFHELEELSKLK